MERVETPETYLRICEWAQKGRKDSETTYISGSLIMVEEYSHPRLRRIWSGIIPYLGVISVVLYLSRWPYRAAPSPLRPKVPIGFSSHYQITAYLHDA